MITLPVSAVTAALLTTRQPCKTCRGEGVTYDLRCDNCGASASLPLGMTCSNHLAKRMPCPDCSMLLEWVAVDDPIPEGTTVTIEAGADVPVHATTLGQWIVWNDRRAKALEQITNTEHRWIPLRPGEQVGTAVVAECVPIRTCTDHVEHVCFMSGHLIHHSPLTKPFDDGETEHDISAALPYSDWSHDRECPSYGITHIGGTGGGTGGCEHGCNAGRLPRFAIRLEVEVA